MLTKPPVAEPFPVGDADGRPRSEVGIVWVERTDWKWGLFTHVDGRKLPWREGRGLPMSVRLLPGRHVLGVVAEGDQFGYGNQQVEVDVVAGHTYLVVTVPSFDAPYALDVYDQGGKQCRHEPARREKIVCE